MQTLYFWAILALIGALLYIWPVFSVRRMYEGFADSKPATASVSVAQSQDVAKTLADMKRLLDQGLRTPDLSGPLSLNPPTAELPKPEASGAKKSPEAHSTTKSEPGKVYAAPKESEGLKQGASFQKITSKPTPASPVAPQVIIQKEYIEVPRRCPSQKCPTPKCPNVVCPDMRDYIRKDSIPCWACKLS